MADIPKIRFKGFTEPWEQRKLGEICSRVQGNDGRMELPTLTISAANGWMKQEDRFSGNIAGKEQKNYTLLHKGELSYNHGNSKLAKYGTVFSLQTYEEALVPRVYHSFKVEIGSADFIEYYFATKMPDRELRKLISSGARMDGLLNIGYDDFMGIKMMFPSVLEQDKIAEYFRAFDHLITLHQRKCDDTKELKKYMLQKMFPKNGEKFPEIRFKGFTEAWEQRKLGGMASLITKGTTPLDKSNTGVVNFVKIESIDESSGNITITQKISLDEHNGYLHRSQLKENDILFSIAGTLGRVTSVKSSILPANTNQALAIIRLKDGCLDYVKTYLKGKAVADFIKKNPTIGAQPNLSLEQVANLEIAIPSEDEQKKIGAFFQQLDNLITLHQRKCDTLKELKKYMLQNMFPKKG